MACNCKKSDTVSQRRLEAAPTMKTQADKALTRRQRREAERIAAVAGKAK